jgi:hypothetical protein
MRSAIGDEQATRLATPSIAQRATAATSPIICATSQSAAPPPPSPTRKTSKNQPWGATPLCARRADCGQRKKPALGASAGSHVALVKPAGMPERQWCAGRRVAFNLILGNASRYLSLCSRTATEIFGLAHPPRAQCSPPQPSGAAGADDDRRSCRRMQLEPPAEVTRSECSLPLGSASCSAPALRIEPHNRVARQQHFATDTEHYGEFSHTLRRSSGKTCRAAYGRPSGARSTCR